MNTILLSVAMFFAVDAYDKVYAQGLAHLEAQQYDLAAQQFEQLVREGVASAPLFYNLGLAHHQAGKRGLALANYERALKLEPELVAAADNRHILMSELQRNQSPPLAPPWQEALLFWHGGLGYSTVRWFAIVAWIAFWGTLALRLWKPFRHFAPIAGSLLLVAAMCALSAWVKAHPMRSAVVISEKAPVHYGVQDEGTVRFELFEGDRVRVDETLGEWSRIETVGGESGWVRKEMLVELGPPYESWQKPEHAAALAPSQLETLAAGVESL